MWTFSWPLAQSNTKGYLRYFRRLERRVFIYKNFFSGVDGFFYDHWGTPWL